MLSHRFCVTGFPDGTIDPEGAKNFRFPLHEPYKLDPTTNLPSSADCSRFSWTTYYLTQVVDSRLKIFIQLH